MLKVVGWDDDDTITHDPLHMLGYVITLLPQFPSALNTNATNCKIREVGDGCLFPLSIAHA
jgi:hypothetical protein